MKLEGKSLKSDFLKFIIPSIIAQWVFTIYTMIDGIFVAKGVSETGADGGEYIIPLRGGAVFYIDFVRGWNVHGCCYFIWRKK